MTIPLFYDRELLTVGLQCPLEWQPETHPHLLVVGSTGSGKTYALKLIIGKISLHIPDAQLTLCDYKSTDFASFKGEKRHHHYSTSVDGLQEFYDRFQARLNGENANSAPQFLVFDEWGAFILSQEKKVAEMFKNRLSELLFLGRSYHFHVIIGLQRADSTHFTSGARDQFTAILGLGNLSKEQKNMLFSDFKDEITDNCGRGEGYFLRDGKPIRAITVPTVQNAQKLDLAIRDILTR